MEGVPGFVPPEGDVRADQAKGAFKTDGGYQAQNDLGQGVGSIFRPCVEGEGIGPRHEGLGHHRSGCQPSWHGFGRVGLQGLRRRNQPYSLGLLPQRPQTARHRCWIVPVGGIREIDPWSIVVSDKDRPIPVDIEEDRLIGAAVGLQDPADGEEVVGAHAAGVVSRQPSQRRRQR